jgi:hypothetical protein
VIRRLAFSDQANHDSNRRSLFAKPTCFANGLPMMVSKCLIE